MLCFLISWNHKKKFALLMLPRNIEMQNWAETGFNSKSSYISTASGWFFARNAE